MVDAYVRGYKQALGRGNDWILEIDAGFSHDPRQIPLFFSEMTKAQDCVFEFVSAIPSKIRWRP